MRRRFNAIRNGSRSGIWPDAPSRIAKPKLIQANAASTTPAIRLFTAFAADIAKRPSVILPHTGSTRTATKRK